MKKEAVILFTNHPHKDLQTKRPGTAHPANSFFENYFLDLIHGYYRQAQSQDYNFFICSSDEQLFTQLGINEEYRQFQRGSSFGERFFNSLNDIFELGFNKAVIIGSDIPDLKFSELSAVLRKTSNNSPVTGPSLDGGFYLLSITKDDFYGIRKQKWIELSYGTSSVFYDLIKLFKDHGLKYKFLERKRDVDSFWDCLIFCKYSKLLSHLYNQHIESFIKRIYHQFNLSIFISTNCLNYQHIFLKSPPFTP